MSHTIILHIQNTDPVMGEVDELPNTTDAMVKLNNPRKMDGKDLHYLAENVSTVYWPIERINFIEVMPTEGEDTIIGFVRE